MGEENMQNKYKQQDNKSGSFIIRVITHKAMLYGGGKKGRGMCIINLY
jgi:hypothetical protein